MPLVKTQAEGINLADTFAFTGTISGTSLAGEDAFCANSGASSWASISAGSIVVFNNDSSNDNFDTGNRFDTSTYKYSARADGVYLFWYSMYTAENGTTNAFGFLKDSTTVQMDADSAGYFTFHTNTSNDYIQNGKIVIPLSANETIAVVARYQSDYYRGYSMFGGCRLA